ncbi:conidial pigment biosynthesis oxidase arb2 brown2 [Colletotrichum tofieldiae]|nr:conidial pigment biosynthesis oxidase arb2 brown2 [Colletotrichum tofieldiae]
MHGTPWSDGAPGLSQKPIESSQSFVYRFKASPAGTHWYHSHSRTTVLDGLYSPIFIRSKPDAPAPWHLISQDPADLGAMCRAAVIPEIIMVPDWTRFKSWEYMEAEENSGMAILEEMLTENPNSCSDSILINGKGSLYCPGVETLINHTSTYMKYGLYPRQVNDKGCFPFMKSTQGPYLRAGKPEAIPLHLQHGCVPSEAQWASLNFIGGATFKTTVFSVDEHDMWVYEVDGSYIVPQRVDTVHMYAGERYAVMIKLNKPAKDYTIRVADNGLTQVISAFARLRYRGGNHGGESRGWIDYGGQNNTNLERLLVTLDREHLPPYPPNPPARKADAKHVLQTHRWKSAWKYTISGHSMYGEDRSAYEPLLYDPNSADAMDEGLVIQTKNGSWVDLVLQVGSQPGQPQEFPHMMHKHTGKTWQIGAVFGIWNYSSVDEAMAAEPERFDLKTPKYRDTFVTSSDGSAWIVLRNQVTNPGPWLFHCHIETHLAGGMAIVILDGVDAWPQIPPEYGPDRRGYMPGTHSDLDGGEHRALIQTECPLGAAPGSQSTKAGVAGVDDDGRWKSLLRSLIAVLQAWASEEPAHGTV